MKFLNFLAGFLQDQGGAPSSKRLTLYICLFFLGMLVSSAAKGTAVDFNTLMVVAGIILFNIGAVTSEFFTKFSNTNKKE